MSQLAGVRVPSAPLRVALVGSPNSGKTTLFNALTGSRAKVGNYPGVTVERREGTLRQGERPCRVLDLPGLYSFSPETPDEAIAAQVLQGRRGDEPAPDALVVVLDGTTLRRGLGLVAQVLELERPTALVVTMIDEVRARGGSLDLGKLSRILGIPVVGVVGHRGLGLPELLRLLEGPERWSRPAILPPVAEAEERFAWVDAVVRQIGAEALAADRRTDRLDRILLHPVGGLVAFATVMVFLFQSIFTWAVPLMDSIDAGVTALGLVSRQ